MLKIGLFGAMIQISKSQEGYWSSTVYNGITCGNTNGNEDFVITQTGIHFGKCILGYDSYGVAVSSAIYTLDCSGLNGNGNYQGTYTLYGDLECLSKPISTSTYTQAGTCFTNNGLTTSYTCVTDTTKLPYSDLPGGYILGYVSSL